MTISVQRTGFVKVKWRIPGFRALTANKLRSEVFELGGYKW